MLWLNLVSNLAAVLAAAATLAALLYALRYRLAWWATWQGRSFFVILLAAIIVQATTAAVGPVLPHAGLLLAARVLFLAAAVMVLPLARRVAAQSSQASVQQAQSRLDLARAEASESRHWLQLAEKIARVAHWRYSVADRELKWSEEAYCILGLPPDGPAPALESFLGLITAEDRARAAGLLDSAVAGLSPFEMTVKIARPEGFGHIIIRGIPELDEAGRAAALFGVFVDVTAQKRIEDELKEAHHASEAANRALEDLAMHDSLTRLPNRRMFDTTIAAEFKRAAREMQPIGLIMIDLDYFKAFNDNYGHLAGDACLRRVAEAIAGVPQRPADLVARYGGEEIVVLLPNTDLTGTETVADLLVKAVRDLRIQHHGNPERIVTISCGAAAFEPDIDSHAPFRLIERADQALYKAKRAGRNRAVSQAIAA